VAGTGTDRPAGLCVTPAGFGVVESVGLGVGLVLGLALLGLGLGLGLALGLALLGLGLGLDEDGLVLGRADGPVLVPFDGVQEGVGWPRPPVRLPAEVPAGTGPPRIWLPEPSAVALGPGAPEPPWMIGRMNAPDCEMTCGSAVRAKAPMATTKTAVVIAAAGRSHA
jgi:hypothetical protein